MNIWNICGDMSLFGVSGWVKVLCLFSTQNQVWILRNGVWWPSFSFSSVPEPCRSLPTLDHGSKLLVLLPISFYSHFVCFVSLFPFWSLLHWRNYSAANMSPTSCLLPTHPCSPVDPVSSLSFLLQPHSPLIHCRSLSSIHFLSHVQTWPLGLPLGGLQKLSKYIWEYRLGEQSWIFLEGRKSAIGVVDAFCVKINGTVWLLKEMMGNFSNSFLLKETLCVKFPEFVH